MTQLWRPGDHVTITQEGDRLAAVCQFCGMSVDAPRMMGGIPGANLLTAFAVLHEHKTKRGERP